MSHVMCFVVRFVSRFFLATYAFLVRASKRARRRDNCTTLSMMQNPKPSDTHSHHRPSCLSRPRASPTARRARSRCSRARAVPAPPSRSRPSGPRQAGRSTACRPSSGEDADFVARDIRRKFRLGFDPRHPTRRIPTRPPRPSPRSSTASAPPRARKTARIWTSTPRRR